ncbi:MAG: hypothetical protein IPJ88_10535 [Myxococcales bacterium]|nr:MAG: hypothetical protein IPJ88_10535 [Myxococcales bacterium]
MPTLASSEHHNFAKQSLRISVAACLLLITGCTENINGFDENISSGQVSFLAAEEQPSEFEVSIRDSNRPDRILLHRNGTAERLHLSMTTPKISVQTNEDQGLVSLEISEGPIKGIFDYIEYDDVNEAYAVKGLGFVDVQEIVTAINDLFSDFPTSEGETSNFSLCGVSAEEQSAATISQFQFLLRFFDAEDNPTQQLETAQKIEIELSAFTLHTRQICGFGYWNRAEKTEVQIDLKGHFSSVLNLAANTPGN